MDLSNFEFGQRLRLFRFYGQMERYEDNVTRALLSVIVRSLSGATFLRALLEAFVKRGTHLDGPLTVCCDLLHQLPTAKLVSVDTQQTFACDETRPRPVFALLVEIIPGDRISVPQATIPVSGSEGSRVDGVFRFERADGEDFVVVIESKLFGQETHEKLKKYVDWLGANQCAIVSSKWDEVIRAIESMPEPNRKEAIVEDFVEYLESFPGLLGFRGFKGSFFSEEFRTERLHELRLLCNSLVPGKFSQWGQKKFDPSGDFDLYAWDQFALIGNVGIATWDDRCLWAKLVIGVTNFAPDQLAQIQKESGRKHPLGPTYWGTRLLLGADQAEVAAVFERLTRALTGVEFGVGF